MKPTLLTSLASLSGLTLSVGITATAVAQVPATTAAPAAPKAPLNVLFFTADDMGWFTPAAMGSPAHIADVTPNLDRFATQSIAFQRAHVTVAICQPSRGALTTGMYPHTSGVEGFNHTPGHVNTIMSELRNHGYLVGVLGKVPHSTPDASFQWDMTHDIGDLGHGRNPEKYAAYLREFIQRCKKEGKPFYFMCNSHDPHRPFCGSAQDLQWRKQRADYPQPSRIFTPAEMKVPGFFPDIPAVREELAQYTSSARRCDDTFGAVMKVLDDEGVAGNTIVVFLSDNGMSAPFSKTNAYYNSTRTPLMVRWPGVVKPGSKDTTHFVGGIDYMPTILDALGFTPPAGVDGRSYLPLLRGEEQDNRDHVFTQIYATVTAARYPMFAVEDAQYRLIYNPWADGKYRFRNDSQGGLAFKGMVEAGKTNKAIQDRVDLLLYRVPLELYDLQKDPDALNNLAKDPAHADDVARMSALLQDWMKRYDTNPLAAFGAFPDEKARLAYMTAQLQLGKEKRQAKDEDKADKADKAAAKGKSGGGKKGKSDKQAKPAPAQSDEDDE